MENEYMLKIWGVIGTKENQNLTVKEQQDKIVDMPFFMEKDTQAHIISEFKKQCLKAIELALSDTQQQSAQLECSGYNQPLSGGLCADCCSSLSSGCY